VRGSSSECLTYKFLRGAPVLFGKATHSFVLFLLSYFLVCSISLLSAALSYLPCLLNLPGRNMDPRANPGIETGSPTGTESGRIFGVNQSKSWTSDERWPSSLLHLPRYICISSSPLPHNHPLHCPSATPFNSETSITNSMRRHLSLPEVRIGISPRCSTSSSWVPSLQRIRAYIRFFFSFYLENSHRIICFGLKHSTYLCAELNECL
jgi:hypothetical protein